MNPNKANDPAGKANDPAGKANDPAGKANDPAHDPPPRFVGLDVHKHQITYCILDGSGGQLASGEFSLDAVTLLAFIEQKLTPGDHVALEATTNCWAVAEHLQSRVRRVVVSNPMATAAIAKSKVKTDKVDAKVLANLLRCDFLPEVWKPDADTMTRRQLTGRRAGLVAQRTRLRNRIHAVLAMRLIVVPAKLGGLFTAAGTDWLNALDTEAIDEDGLRMIRSDLRLLESLAGEIAEFDVRIAQLGYADQRVKLLMTMPGISTVVASTLVAAWGDIERFESASKAASYLGLTPSTRSSAGKTHHGPITKAGNRQARTMLVQAAQCIGRQPGPLGHFFRKLKKRKNHNIAVVATARKMAEIAWRMLRANEPYRYSVPRSTGEKLARLRIEATGQRRRGGPKKGVKGKALVPGRTGGSRRVGSLAETYVKEGVPAPRGLEQLSAGERRHVVQSEAESFVHQISSEQIVPRGGKAEAAKEQKAETAGGTQAASRQALSTPA